MPSERVFGRDAILDNFQPSPFDKLPRQAGAGRAGSQGLKSLRENPHCVVPSGLDLREILPGTPVPGYRLSRPFRD